MKQIESKCTEELLLSTFGLYFVNVRGWSATHEDSGIIIQLIHLNLFNFTVLEVSLLDFVANNTR